jgi:hypothetical protein
VGTESKQAAGKLTKVIEPRPFDHRLESTEQLSSSVVVCAQVANVARSGAASIAAGRSGRGAWNFMMRIGSGERSYYRRVLTQGELAAAVVENVLRAGVRTSTAPSAAESAR